MQFSQTTIEWIQHLKSQCGLTNRQIADKVGYSEGTVQRYVSASVKGADPDISRRIIDAMGGNADDILAASTPARPTTPTSSLDQALARVYEQHRQEITSLKEAHAETTASCKDNLAHSRRQTRALAAVVAVLVAFILALFMIGILNPNVGWFRRALNNDVSTTSMVSEL